MSDIAETMRKMQQEEEQRALQLQLSGMRQAIEAALCEGCGDPIGDQDWELEQGGERPRLVHKECLTPDGLRDG